MSTSSQAIKKPKSFASKLISLIGVGLFINLIYVESIYTLLGFKGSYTMQSTSLNAVGEVIEKNETVYSTWLQEKVNALSVENFLVKTTKYQNYLSNKIEEKLKDSVDEDVLSGKVRKGVTWIKKVSNEQAILLLITLKILIGKLFVLVLSSPLFLLTALVGFVDGLSAREVRKAELGRESSYIFHRLSGWVMTLIGFSLLVWFVFPLPIKPSHIFLPLSLILMLSIRMASSRFKKYL